MSLSPVLFSRITTWVYRRRNDSAGLWVQSVQRRTTHVSTIDALIGGAVDENEWVFGNRTIPRLILLAFEGIRGGRTREANDTGVCTHSTRTSFECKHQNTREAEAMKGWSSLPGVGGARETQIAALEKKA